MSYPIRLAALLAIILLYGPACQKDPVIKPPVTADPVFEVNVTNQLNELQGQFAVFLSDSDGKVRAFRWLPGSDTVQLQAPGTKSTDRLDCTIVKITTIQGSGVMDTTLTIRTYTQLASGKQVQLQTFNYKQTIDLHIQFTNLNSIDTIIVPDGLTFTRPQASNDFTGFYRVQHTGNMWLRLKVNGEPNWRYLLFNNLHGSTLEATVDVGLLPVMLAAPATITLPFSAPWKYNIEGVIDTAHNQLLALGDLLRAPGGTVPILSNLSIYEPAAKPYQGYRIALSGSSNEPGGYSYAIDDFFATIPGSLPAPAFDLEPTTVANNRFIAVKCLGSFDLLVLARSRSGAPNINWEALLPPANGIVTYRLPDVPSELGQRFNALQRYEFGNAVRVRAEQYSRLDGYENIVRQLLTNDDPLWLAKAGYLSREEIQ